VDELAFARPEPPLVPLGLGAREQWVLHGVLADRVERSRRRRATAPPPPEVGRTLRKVESGRLLFTVAELRAARETLLGYLGGGSVPDGERRAVRRVVERIGEARARARRVRPH
jgi:hypothetical protein